MRARPKFVVATGHLAPDAGPPDTPLILVDISSCLHATRCRQDLRSRPRSSAAVAEDILDEDLLPISWSTRTGVEVGRPLAAPVVDTTLSSPIHILVVTPVIFAWLRERALTTLARFA